MPDGRPNPGSRRKPSRRGGEFVPANSPPATKLVSTGRGSPGGGRGSGETKRPSSRGGALVSRRGRTKMGDRFVPLPETTLVPKSTRFTTVRRLESQRSSFSVKPLMLKSIGVPTETTISLSRFSSAMDSMPSVLTSEPSASSMRSCETVPKKRCARTSLLTVPEMSCERRTRASRPDFSTRLCSMTCHAATTAHAKARNAKTRRVWRIMKP